MIKKITVDGNEACAKTAYLFTEVAGIYPITPSSPMAEHVDDYSNKHIKNLFNDEVKVVEMQSEAGAAGMIHGSLQTGLLTTTFTASQGLLLMIPNMYKMSGEMLPAVIHVAARSLSTHALSIFGDHQDIYAIRQTGFCILASSSVQDASYLSAVAHLSAIKGSLPFLHFFDGFRTSHEINKINILDKDDYKEMLDKDALNRFRKRALNPLKPQIKGTAENDDIYFQVTESRNNDYKAIPDIVNDYMSKINEKAGTNYAPFNYYGSKKATKVIIAMGSVCNTIKEVIDDLKEDIGLIEVHLYRPFSTNYLLSVLPKTTSKIAVLDRTKEFGSTGEPLYLDVVAALKNKDIEIVGGRYGLSSKNVAPNQIKAVYDMLNTPKNNFTIGINDDVTNLSLKLDDNYKLNICSEMLIYGYGSDGMVSASKSIIKIIGENTEKYVQGYFEYDSKKSGGVTVSHLRFKDGVIREPYYVQNPKLIVCTKDKYLNDFDLISNIKENGTFLLNTMKNEDEVNKLLNDNYKNILVKKKIKVYTIDAYSLSESLGLGNKISTIMASLILKMINLIDYNKSIKYLKEMVYKEFYTKGDEVVEANYAAIDKALDSIKEIKITVGNNKKVNNDKKTIYSEIVKRNGNNLSTADVLKIKDGTYDAYTSANDKRGISSLVPKWLNENCIMCNQCSFICPHGVIRPFLLNKKEYEEAPDYIKGRCIIPILPNLKDYYYILSFSVLDCTGCKVCINNCPGKHGNKALEFDDLEKLNEEQKIFNYLEKKITDKNIDKYSVIGSQFKEPKFRYSGACAGCGETAYIKLLTQLFGNQIIISNATGCSSIYGASMPSMPYNVPWASSLFEDNAEYGYGMVIANNTIRNRIKDIMLSNMNNKNKTLFKKWIDNMYDYDITKKVYNNLDYKLLPKELSNLKDYLLYRNIWMIGGDGWAYDIGFGGIDHVLSSNDNVNILVLDSQVYSNTGGQASKASPKGAVASFASTGKKVSKKDLARIALSYPNVYVATVSMGANLNQVVKAFEEAEKHHGPSIIIAYSPCISHGIKGGMQNSTNIQRLATKCGYFPIFRYNPETKTFTLDSKNTDFNIYEEFLNMQTRYSSLKILNKDMASKLLKDNKDEAIERFEYYKKLDNSEKS